jgi:hypothetical protein
MMDKVPKKGILDIEVEGLPAGPSAPAEEGEDSGEDDALSTHLDAYDAAVSSGDVEARNAAFKAAIRACKGGGSGKY